MKVLLLADDADLRDRARTALEREGIDVVEAITGADALVRMRRDPVELVVLDVDIPDGSGLELIAPLRAIEPNVHVIVLSSSAGEADRVRGLSAGADDYLAKPCSLPELVARVAAVRRRLTSSMLVSEEVSGVSIDLERRTVTVGGAPVTLTRREFDLLHHLAASPGRTFTRDELLTSVWKSSALWQGEATITEHISRLRKKLEIDPDRPSLIVTLRGIGYRFDPAPTSGVTPAESTLADAGDATVVVAGGRIVSVTAAAATLLRADPQELIGLDVMQFVAPSSVAAVEARRARMEAGTWPRPELITIRRSDGDDVLVELASTPVPWDGGTATQLTVWDLTRDTARLRELATGIRTEVADAVIVADAESHIRSVNTAAEQLYGWSEAEVVGKPIFEAFPFVVGTRAFDEVREALLAAGRWHADVEQIRRDGSTVHARASVTLVRDGGNQPVGAVAVLRPTPPPRQSASADARAHMNMVDDVRRGLALDEFIVDYQPVVRLEDLRVLGGEALVRWRHPERGVLLPAEFVPEVEQSDLIADLGRAVLVAACNQARAWRHAGHDLHVAVNVSGRQLSDATLPRQLDALMRATAMPRGMLWLEVTETSLVEDLDVATRVSHQIDELGICLSIDDFGTGWASLLYLRQLRVHALKIDRAFVDGLGRERRADAIVRSIISLGAELDIAVVAEGIETQEQRRRLLRLGCVVGQGYLLGAPRAADQILDPA